MRVLTTKFIRSSKGASMVVFALALSLIVGSASIAVDIGVIVYEKSRLSNAVDAAALAGAQDLHNGRESALSTARTYLSKNGVDPANADINVSDDETSLGITVRKDVEHFFAKILGFDKGTVKAAAEAKTVPVSAIPKGVRPFAVENQNLVFGSTYILKEDAGDGYSGNYYAMAFGGTGSTNYKDKIINGYNGKINVGDLIDTETGNMKNATETGVGTIVSKCTHFPKCTFDNFERDCARVITVVVVTSLDVNGRKMVKILGFASFFVDGVTNQGGHIEITGKFVRNIANGELSESQTDFGLRGVRLIH